MPKLAGVPSDQLSVARLVAVELQARDAGDQRLQQRLALDEGRLAMSRPSRCRRSKTK
jgi:hypothetical protein